MRALLLAVPFTLLAACGNKPPAEATVCDGGAQTLCAGSCVELQHDSAHCGQCGAACAADEACAGAHCYPQSCDAGACASTQVCISEQCIDRDCFGVTCPQGQACAHGACVAQDCMNQTCGPTQVCSDGTCVEAACYGVVCPNGLTCFMGRCELDTCGDGVQSGNETGPDCGGRCKGCADGRGCNVPGDCTSYACVAGRCAPASCGDDTRNGNESDVDCGGTCPGCPAAAACNGQGDCQSRVCTSGRCAAPTCSDTQKNGLETDVDCGGNCAMCANGKGCAANTDCTSGKCTQDVCVPGTCSNGIKDPGETDMDCGGPCAGCPPGRTCAVNMDCGSGICTNLLCASPLCVDMVKNGLETDVDCGGGCPNPCQAGKGCKVGGDCFSQVCTQLVCQAPACDDGIKNGFEVDVDCGGTSLCARCGTGKSCTLPGDCKSGVCTANKCEAVLWLGAPVTYAVGNTPWDLAIGQLDSDGRLDIAVANRNSYDVSLLFAVDGGFAPAVAVGVSQDNELFGPEGIALGDVNGDGLLDIVTARTRDVLFDSQVDWCRVTIHKNLGSRAFGVGVDFTESSQYQTSSGCGNRVLVGNFDFDGLMDIVTTDADRTDCARCGPTSTGERFGSWFWRSLPDGGLAAPQRLPNSGSWAVAVDANRDGQLDVISRNWTIPSVSNYLNDAGTLQLDVAMAVNAGAGDIAAGLFDADPWPDVAWSSRETNEVGVARGQGNGRFAGPVNYSVAGAYGTAVGDLDRDGKVDLVIGSSMGIAILKGRGDGTFESPVYNATSLGRVGKVAVADLDRDGKLDVVTLAGGSLRVLYNITP